MEPWAEVGDAVLDTARSRAIEALSDRTNPGVAERLAVFYDPEGNYSGPTFLGIQPNPRDDITAADVLALSVVRVRTGPRSVRRFLDEGELRRDVLEALATVPDDVDLADADLDVLQRMEGLYDAVKRAAADGNAWVTAAKLCARKRPLLYPLLDAEVREYLELASYRSHRLNWEVFRRLMRDPEIVDLLEHSRSRASGYAIGRGMELQPDTIRLKLLGAALWTCATMTG